MRVAYLFFLSLCFLLLGGCNYGYNGAHHNRSYSQVQTPETIQKVKVVNLSQDFPVITNASLSEEKAYIVSFEDEDEDLDFARKYVLLAKCFFILSYSFIFSSFYNYFKDTLPFCKHLSYCSYKYILQRVLRI
ncbi:MAG: hypothetical protein JWN56_1958 [Sphingobacteriales bacterium]|nr:hypothetical protein [Sphingobacteriales bacterium]